MAKLESFAYGKTNDSAIRNPKEKTHMDIKYYLLKNETETAAAAPYTMRVVPNGVVNTNDVVAEMLTRISTTDQRARMVLAEALKVALEHIRAGETVDFGGIRLKAQIPGSSPCEDTPFDPLTGEVLVCAYVDDELRDTFDGIAPVKISAADAATSIKVSNVMDVATEQFGVVIGSTPFAILGNGITLDAEGEYAKALDRKTGEVKGTATVQSVSKGQRAYCKFNPQLAAGDYTLEVATKGLVGETTPRVFRKPITAVYVTPTLPKVVLKNGEVDEYTVKFDVENMEAIRGYSVTESGVKIFNADVYHNGQEDEKDVIVSQFAAAGSKPQFSREGWNVPGTVIKIVAHVNPEKTGYDQSDAVYEFTVS